MLPVEANILLVGNLDNVFNLSSFELPIVLGTLFGHSYLLVLIKPLLENIIQIHFILNIFMVKMDVSA